MGETQVYQVSDLQESVSKRHLCIVQGQLWEATRPKLNSDDLLRPPRPMIVDTNKDERDLTPEEWRRRLDGRRH